MFPVYGPSLAVLLEVHPARVYVLYIGTSGLEVRVKAVEGIYDGKRIKTLEPLHMPANVRVIITFLDSPPPALRRTRVEDVAGCLAYSGPAKSLADMEKAIAKGAKEHRL